MQCTSYSRITYYVVCTSVRLFPRHARCTALVRAVRRVVERLTLSRRIPSAALRRPNETSLNLNGLCGGAAAHELFLADSSLGREVVREFDVRAARLDARDAYTAPAGEFVNDVAYSAKSDSLFVATWSADKSEVNVRSLARTNGQWSVCHCIQLTAEVYRKILLHVLRDGTLLCSQINTGSVHLCRVHSDRSLQNCTRVAFPVNHLGFDAQLFGNERRIAAALQDGSVSLFRVDAVPVYALVPLSRVDLSGARIPLFFGESLLVGVATDNDVREAVSFSMTDGRLQRDRQLIPHDDRPAIFRLFSRDDRLLDIYRWRFVEGTLIVCDYNSKELLLFNAA